MSAATDPNAVMLEFLSRFHRIAGVSFYAMVMVDGLEQGQYRVVESGRLDDASVFENVDLSPDSIWDVTETLPVCTGGLIGALIEGESPKGFGGLEITNDPVLGDKVSGMRSVLAVPVFRDGEIHFWALMFRTAENPPEMHEARMAVANANLLSRGIDYLTAVQESQRLNERLNQQLLEVAQVQQSLLPTKRPAIPGFSIATSYLTSDDAGGDYYDFFEHPNGLWGLVIADVSGHGAGAATVMAMLHAILHADVGDDIDPASVIRRANRHLTRHLRDGTFVTAFYGLLDPETGTLKYSSSGHNPPRLKPAGSEDEIRSLSVAAVPPLGLIDDYEPLTESVQLEPGDTLILYTDGITEAFNRQREMFGVEGLDASLTDCAGNPDCVIESIHRSLYAHTGTRRRADDQTLVVVQRMPS